MAEKKEGSIQDTIKDTFTLALVGKVMNILIEKHDKGLRSQYKTESGRVFEIQLIERK